MMGFRAKACIDAIEGGSIGVSSFADLAVQQVGPSHATALLTSLSKRGLSRASVKSYYAAFKRMVDMAGGDTHRWPKAPKPPRIKRNVETLGIDYHRLTSAILKLEQQGHTSTALLMQLLIGSGMRVDVEALDWKAWEVDPERALLKVTGKGGHYREVPVSEGLVKAIQERKALITSMKRVPYNTHYKRLRMVDPGLGFHDVRRWYATNAYKRSGKDIRVVQELLGHADVSTTAGYIGVNVEDLRKGACDDE